jgi:hypothetical protein
MAYAINCLFCVSDERVALAESGEKMGPLIDADVVVNLLKFAQQIDDARIPGSADERSRARKSLLRST